MVTPRRPFITAGLTVLLLFGALRTELDLHTKHVAVAGLHRLPAPASTAHVVTPHPAPRRHYPHTGPLVRHRSEPRTGAATAPPSTLHAAPVAPQRQPTRSAQPTPKPTQAKAPVSGTFTGSAASTPYGNVQVQIKVANGQITDVIALQMPNDNRRSQQISQTAGPQLRQEALDAQSANIDDVSGATYTSDAYRQSLQAAIDSAGLR